MSLPLALPSLIGLVAGLTVIGMLVVRFIRRRQQAVRRLREDADFDLVFPEHPRDKSVRGTVAGRQVTRR